MAGHGLNLSRRLLLPSLLVTVSHITCANVTAGDSLTESLVEVRLNGETRPGASLVLLDSGQDIYVSRKDLDRWDLHIPAGARTIRRNDREYVDANRVRGLSATLDSQAQRLDLNASAELIPATTFQTETDPSVVTRSPPGAFLNYQLDLERGQDSAAGGAFEFGAFRGAGFGSTTFMVTDYSAQTRAVRLDSFVKIDLPGQQSSVQIGDNVTSADAAGRAVRFGGIRFGTDFSTTPGFIPFPVPQIRGQTAVPSTVDLYVDNVLQMRHDAAPGPFTFDRVPVATGSGQLQLRVRDALGRQQVITQSYYTSPALLRTGLHDWSVELGSQRSNYGINDADYGPAFAGARFRSGVSDTVTMEWHGTVSSQVTNVGAGISALAGRIGVLTVGAMAAQSTRGSGASFDIGFDRSAQRFSVGFSAGFETRHFWSLRSDAYDGAARWRAVAHVGLAAGCCGSVSLFGVMREAGLEPAVRAVTISVNRAIWSAGNLALMATKDFADGGASSVLLLLSRAIGSRQSLSIGALAGGADRGVQGSLQQNLTAGNGFGYRVSAQQSTDARAEAQGIWQGDTGVLTLGAAQFNSQRSWRASASGAVAHMGGDTVLTRPLTDSFAIVEVPGQAGLPVYRDQQWVTQTDARGVAILQNLRPFERNRISVKPEQLPLAVEVTKLDLFAVPYRHGGLFLRFDLMPKSRLVRLRLRDGTAVPAGADARASGRLFPVAREGATFVSGDAAWVDLTVAWDENHCEARVPLNVASEAAPADIICEMP